MLNITLTDEQVFSLISQLPQVKKKELLDQLQFEEWLDSPEALDLKEKSEKAIQEGRVYSILEVKEKLKAHGKEI
jgi:hypothetical protein